MKNYFQIVLLLLLCTSLKGQVKNVFDVARKGTLSEIQNIYKQNPELVNAINDNKATPLILACYRNNEAVALYLSDIVSNINYNSGMGTALMAAIMSGNKVIIEKLISKKADLDQQDIQGKTALIYAAFNNNFEVAQLLVKAGANSKLADNEKRTALDYAKFNKNTQLIILLDK
ncbi:MAG: ankyrin repeat domain-containing protein [Flavobacteriaceae bacterium]|jgi:ankyrin repeat protein|nr:ankyrin repeat domain-containing protein [Flavobacteriaceae bacterium]